MFTAPLYMTLFAILEKITPLSFDQTCGHEMHVYLYFWKCDLPKRLLQFLDFTINSFNAIVQYQQQ